MSVHVHVGFSQVLEADFPDEPGLGFCGDGGLSTMGSCVLRQATWLK